MPFIDISEIHKDVWCPTAANGCSLSPFRNTSAYSFFSAWHLRRDVFPLFSNLYLVVCRSEVGPVVVVGYFITNLHYQIWPK